MLKRSWIAAALAAGLLPGCTTLAPQQPAPTVGLSQALTDTIDALAAAKARWAETDQHSGMDVCSLTATFNVSSQAVTNNKGGVTLGITQSSLPVTLGGSGSHEVATTQAQGNTITLVLTTPACNPAGTLGTINPDKVGDLARQNALVRAGQPVRVPAR
jgi:hypothetical protein